MIMIITVAHMSLARSRRVGAPGSLNPGTRSKTSKGSKHTAEEKAERARISTTKCHYDNLENGRERKRLCAQRESGRRRRLHDL